MSEQHEQEYDQSLVQLLELVWGEGYLSPGGPEEIAELLHGADLGRKSILDVGCGTGGIDTLLVQQYGAAHVTGIDTAETVIQNALERAEDLGLTDKLAFELVEPGPFRFADGAFDMVFSKDALIHVADKTALFQEIFRVLRPGGLFIASDWLCRDPEPSEAMQRYIKEEGLDFGMARPVDYETAMMAAGFTGLEFRDRNSWYREVARKEWQDLSGPLRDRVVELIGEDMAKREINVWRTMVVVLDSGELRPTHMRATRPE